MKNIFKKKTISADAMTIDDLKDLINEDIEKDIRTFEDLISLEASANRHIYINDVVYGLGQLIEECIEYWNRQDEKNNIPIAKRQPIMLYINSYGGDLNEAFTIINAIENSKTPVYGINIGCAYSAGFFIFITCQKRFCYRLSSFLYHEGAASTGGTASQFQNFSAFYKKQLGQLKEHVLAYTNISEEKYKEIQKDDFWMTADEAINLKVADEIITKETVLWEK